MSQWIDITRAVDETLISWPGRPRPQHRWEKNRAAGDHCNASSWQISAHSGTHMDAPLHFIADGQSIDRISPDVFIGECQVIDLSASAAAPLDAAGARQYAGVERLLVRTSPARAAAAGESQSYPALMTDEAAALLLSAGLVLVGTERLSVDDSRGESFALHHRLLGAGCVILEGLLLSDVAAGTFFLYAAPLRLTGTEASPVRALLGPAAPR